MKRTRELDEVQQFLRARLGEEGGWRIADAEGG
jgi:hypothetical protein